MLVNNKYYVMGSPTPDGPFETFEEGVEFLKEIAHDFASPEILNMRLCYNYDGYLLTCRDASGEIITGRYVRGY